VKNILVFDIPISKNAQREKIIDIHTQQVVTMHAP